MILRATFANITPDALASRVQASGLSGTVFASIGAGDWGVEPGATVEFVSTKPATRTRVEAFVAQTLEALGEQAAYVTVDGALAFLRWNDGRVEQL